MITIESWGRDPTAINQLLESIRAAYFDQGPGKVATFRASCGKEPGWELIGSQSRAISTIAMDAKQKEAVVNDLKRFTEPSESKWHLERGIPYRRGYLFHGPSGTGKTSLCLALATLFQLPIYSMILGAMDDELLFKLFHQLPQRCMVLLEDIDTSPVAQTRPQYTEPQQRQQGNGLTLSGLLNIIDGSGAPEGRVLVMSTNYPDKLDPAITRSGRVDMKVKFELVNKESAGLLFQSLVLAGSSVTEKDSANVNVDNTSRDLAAEFKENISEGVVRHADLQEYLVARRRDPRAAVDEVSAWFEAARSRIK
ncbi:hypothetical protein CORC01_13278 [Colletotrichum orchidophilum]|uniref:AAA+ ATPase domain-containing protein n=1 Tax=Colletotrichum orchidophilum TaxID=1209926 RepID=A0A1G4AQP2_9PEZI|nr:uncharacterized protein CORC01_13278 [Colletotrichum orchidophilum]OHE91413.1 hypothetical protein CORC01_13278 [Colletotrichum orchidophilum]